MMHFGNGDKPNVFMHYCPYLCMCLSCSRNEQWIV